ncbi:lipase [Clostridium botulinum]|uniref:Lipase/acylhydrolase, GDSL family n=1 Tax=Clostridium botulinum (strain Langeland / NCTC 10281 / Type F) TaxID=441772 RepID=A7GHC0_CLOBL|nr:GDSL-type esterase/lipase family protein [Clostridium botulinum]ABS42041.1 lipase/acylhydrolase, GDSL family [Clostridium botulinum F str. Langeland]ADG00560.1 lipase/acylhydrolase, GDSL family [Clostridium botulinum F str. 230613]KKM40943.1 lipase [Clostridium botulinum]MBD5644540.1 lipase [Clostridium botulinum]MBY6792489.1 lipase [Clostridium botulinum]
MKIICIGDSLTFGYGINRNYCWVTLLKNILEYEVINKGINGDTTTGILTRSHEDIIKNKSTHTIILIGTNDFLLGRSLENVEQNLNLIIKECVENNITPIIGVPMEIEIAMAQKIWTSDLDYLSVNNKLTEYRKYILNISKENNFKYIDFFSAIKEHKSKCKASELFVDGIHPTPLGHKIMFNKAYEIFK